MQEIITKVSIKIPDDYVLVEKAEIRELRARAEPEWVSGLDWLSKQTGIKSHQQLKEKLLFPHKDELIEFTDYPNGNGELWRFNTYPMKHWLRTNFTKVVK